MLPSVRCRWVQASAWTISREQPASMYCLAMTSGVYTIRCASNGTRAVRPGRRDHVGAEREVRDELAVHHVPLDQVDAGGFECGDLVAELGEVGGEDGRGDLDRAGHDGGS